MEAELLVLALRHARVLTPEQYDETREHLEILSGECSAWLAHVDGRRGSEDTDDDE